MRSLARWCVRHRLVVLGIWLMVLVGTFFGQSTLGLVQRDLERAGIDLEQDIAFVHEGALAIGRVDQISGDLRPHLRVDIAVERGDPLAFERHGLRGQLEH